MFNLLIGLTLKKTSKPILLAGCEGNPPLVNSLYKGQVTWKHFHIMTPLCNVCYPYVKTNPLTTMVPTDWRSVDLFSTILCSVCNLHAVSYYSCDIVCTVDSIWWSLMAWHLINVQTSVATTMSKAGRCMPGTPLTQMVNTELHPNSRRTFRHVLNHLLAENFLPLTYFRSCRYTLWNVSSWAMLRVPK